MKWIDYREKLGIGFNDKQKFDMLRNKLFLQLPTLKSVYSDQSYTQYLLMVGESVYRFDGYSINGVISSFQRATSIGELISKYIAFYNTFEESPEYRNSRGERRNSYGKDFALAFMENSLGELNIPYELFEDEDGIYVFPKGVPELDGPLVSEIYDWLKKYPAAEKSWGKALRAYAEVTANSASDVADLFRKALETFFKEFFRNEKSIENNKVEYGRYLKEQGIPSELSNNLESILQGYTNFMNNYAKHNDKTSVNVLEYLMYQTGNTIRLLISLK